MPMMSLEDDECATDFTLCDDGAFCCDPMCLRFGCAFEREERDEPPQAPDHQ